MSVKTHEFKIDMGKMWNLALIIAKSTTIYDEIITILNPYIEKTASLSVLYQVRVYSDVIEVHVICDTIVEY